VEPKGQLTGLNPINKFIWDTLMNFKHLGLLRGQIIMALNIYFDLSVFHRNIAIEWD